MKTLVIPYMVVGCIIVLSGVSSLGVDAPKTAMVLGMKTRRELSLARSRTARGKGKSVQCNPSDHRLHQQAALDLRLPFHLSLLLTIDCAGVVDLERQLRVAFTWASRPKASSSTMSIYVFHTRLAAHLCRSSLVLPMADSIVAR